ncbi:MAG: enoyl-CoA hydratase/isomerase family protein [Anaerolineae bacterium]|nr:enoyl-CoA hydratase/isomerase family protein [Phycisphaerae bacterium]
MTGNVRIEKDADNIATLWLDAAGKSVNTLNRAMWADLDAALAQLETDKPAALIVASAKNRTFIAGADLFEMRDMDRPALEKYLLDGQVILNRLSKLSCPTVAAINGDALGGGLEVALACKHRVAVDEAGTIGLPETKLGLVPGWGGTVRLPRLVGLREGLGFLANGKAVAPREAQRLAIVDEVTSQDNLLAVARKRLRERPRPRVEAKPDDAQVFAEVERDVRAKTRGQYPAQLRVIEVARAGWENGPEAGLAAELKGLCDLRETPEGRNLMRAFFLRTGAKKAAAKRAGSEPKKIERVAVIGGGVMGAGVAHAVLRAGIPVSLIEVSSDAVDRAKQRLAGLFQDDVSGGRLTQKAADDAMRKLHARSDMDELAKADFILEAVIEQLDAKQEVLAQADEIARPDAIIASNTSSLSIRELSQSTKNPSRVVGLHFFNPVPKMALVEVICTVDSDPTACATAVALASKLGKTPVVVGDGSGFIVNRVLMPYLSEAMRMIGEGRSVEAIDGAIVDWGMPMGPLALIDQIGMDVIAGIFKAMEPHLGERVRLPHGTDQILERGWLGRKTGRGFYVYPPKDQRGAKPKVNDEIVEFMTNSRSGGARDVSPESIQSRLLLPMVNEAARLLSEGVADSTDAIDTATLLGMGFPQFRGGLAAYADSVGAATLVRQLEELESQHGPRFEPAPLLRELAQNGSKLADHRGAM